MSVPIAGGSFRRSRTGCGSASAGAGHLSGLMPIYGSGAGVAGLAFCSFLPRNGADASRRESSRFGAAKRSSCGSRDQMIAACEQPSSRRLTGCWRPPRRTATCVSFTSIRRHPTRRSVVRLWDSCWDQHAATSFSRLRRRSTNWRWRRARALDLAAPEMRPLNQPPFKTKLSGTASFRSTLADRASSSTNNTSLPESVLRIQTGR